MSEAPRSAQSTEADRALALSLAAAIRTAAYFDADNAVMQEVSSALADRLVERVEREGLVRIGVHSHSVFIGAARIRTSVMTYQRFNSLTQTFTEKGINALTIHAGVSPAELTSLTLVLARENVKGPDEIAALLIRRGVVHIEVDMLTPGGGVQTVVPLEAYASAVHLGERLRDSTEHSRPADVRLLRRVTQTLVDEIMEDSRLLIALTTIKELDGQLISHSANVAILSVLLGQRLGLSKTKLGELCLAAFLHDAGKLEVTSDVLEKPGPLDPREWEEMRKHPVTAARSLLGGKRLTTSSMRAVIVAYEHHLNYDMSGYPESKIHDHVSLFGNIVTIADRYDALSTARRYRRFSITPYEAITYLVHYSGTFFDPMLVKLFVEMIGLYPPGTLLLLDNGDLGVVCEAPVAGQPLDRPKVRLWTGGQTGLVVDLAEHANGAYVANVATVLSPADMGQVPAMDLSEFDAGETRRQ
jgi:HD-GYP domain-containing protein (c-di-GMP phosphodiesterase class II)